MNVRILWLSIFSISLASSLISLADPNRVRSNKVTPGVYDIGANGEYYPATNIEAVWPGIWQQNTNGWRVQVYGWNTNGPDAWVSVGIGNTVTNSTGGGGYLWTPNERFAKFELMDSNGMAVLPKKGIILEDQFPSRLPIHDFPKWSDGELKNRMGFFTNSPPWILKQVRIRDLYQLKEEGEYTLTVCPIIYKFGTNAENFVYKIDLPCVTAKIYLKPYLKEQ
jgi:hypothetical protein